MRRILVIGSGGSGKSTLSEQLGGKLSIPVVHLDAHYWRPGWIEPARVEWRAQVSELISRETWVLDGNYSGTLALRLEACDTVVFIDMPRLICLWRVLSRVLKYRGRSRPDMATDCPEKLDIAFLLWIWRYPVRTRPKVLSLIEPYRLTRTVIQLRSSLEVKRFMTSLGAA